jgi:hypothetical protein
MHGPCQGGAVAREPLHLSIRTIVSISYDKAASSINPVCKSRADGYARPVEYLCPDYPDNCPQPYVRRLWIDATRSPNG